MLTGRSYLALFLASFALAQLVSTSSWADAQGGKRGEIVEKPPELEAALIMYKEQYLLREPIWLKVQVTNISKKAAKFSFITHEGLIIEDSNGKRYPCNLAWEYSPITIKPKETLEQQLELLVEYGLPEDSFHVRWYLPPESYTIFFSLSKDVRSETYDFEVLEPDGVELTAMNLLKESHSLFIQKRYDESISKLGKIITEYPRSRYVPYALFKLSGIYRIALEDYNKALEIYHRIINDFPNSGEAISRLSSIIYYYTTKPDEPALLSYLDELTRKHPNTEVAKEAQKELEKLEE